MGESGNSLPLPRGGLLSRGRHDYSTGGYMVHRAFWALGELGATLWDGLREGWRAADLGARLRAWWEIVSGGVVVARD